MHTLMPILVFKCSMMSRKNGPKQLPFYFYVYFEVYFIFMSPPPPTRRTLEHYAGGAPLILLCSHVPMEIFPYYERGKK